MFGLFKRVACSAFCASAGISMLVFLSAGCSEDSERSAPIAADVASEKSSDTTEANSDTAVRRVESSSPETGSFVDRVKLEAVIAARPDDERSRDASRRPVQTLEFFDVGPDMNVLEVLPGGGWYTRVLAPYLAPNGSLHAVTYADDMWDLFGFFTAERIAERKQQMLDWPKFLVQKGGVANGQGAAFNRIPESWNNQFDRVLLIRALHNLNRFESKANTRSQALAEIYAVLKPGGTVGVVQHQAPESAGEEWSNGQNGYLKKSDVIAAFEEAGFLFSKSATFNENALDVPGPEDRVWRLRPSLRGHGDDEAAKARASAIGESNRMTLLFTKPE